MLQSLWQDRDLNKDAMRTVFKNMAAEPRDFMFVAETSDRIVGFIAGAVTNNFYHAGMLCYISTLVVSEDTRGNGIGTKLLRHVGSYACAKNCAAVELDANFYRTASHAFYEHYGFVKRAYTFTLSMEKVKEQLGRQE